MIRLGQIGLQKRYKEGKQCDLCEKDLIVGKWFVKSTGRTKSNKHFTKSYHFECFPQLIIDKINHHRQNPKTNKKKTSRYEGLTEEQIARRRTLQVYLVGKDTTRLLNAYKAKDVTRVKNAYRVIASRWAELAEQEKPFRQTLIARQPQYWTSKQKDLYELMTTYDFVWMGRFQDATDLQHKMELLMREDDLLTFDTD